MSSHRPFSALALAILGLGTMGVVYPQSRPDLDSIARDLRQALQELDQRLTRLEQLSERMEKTAGQPAAKGHPTDAPAAVKLTEAQKAYQRGRSEEVQQNYEQAIAAYTQAVELDGGNDSAFLHRAYAYFEAGRLDLALSDVNHSLAIQPHNAQAYAFRARVYHRLKEFDRAIADLEEGLSRDLNNPEFLLLHGRIEEERGFFGMAAEIYAQAINLRPGSAAIRLNHAAALKKINQLQPALEACEAAIQLDGTSAEAYACRADAYVRLDRVPDAVEDLKQVLRLEPDLPQAANLVAAIRALVELQKLAGNLVPTTPPAPVPVPAPAPAPSAPVAVRDPEIPATSRAKNSPKALSALDQTWLGRTYTQHGRFADALETLTRAVELEPSLALAHNSRGYAYLRTRQFELAIQDFTAAIAINPEYANAYWNRAVAKLLNGDRPGSLADRQKAAALGWINTRKSVIAMGRR